MAKYTRLTPSTTQSVISTLLPQIEQMQGRRSKRVIGEADIIDVLNDIDLEAPRRVREYAAGGFVSNSYKYRADISYIEAERQGNSDEYEIRFGVTGAKRSYGKGLLTVIRK